MHVVTELFWRIYFVPDNGTQNGTTGRKKKERRKKKDRNKKTKKTRTGWALQSSQSKEGDQGHSAEFRTQCAMIT